MLRQSIQTLIAATVAIALPTGAWANTPSPANSTVPACITLVGTAGVVPATSFGRFEVIHRDLANTPVVNDLACWLGDFGSGQSWGRSEFDCNKSVGVNDLSVWLAAYGSGTQVTSCAITCP